MRIRQVVAPVRSAQVLIVDDNEDASSSLTMLLELEDISAASAPDAEAALEIVADMSPQLLLIDIGLPGMNGIELAKHLRALPNTRKSKYIALTGRDEVAEEHIADAFDQYWTKPFDPRKLLAEVKAILSVD